MSVQDFDSIVFTYLITGNLSLHWLIILILALFLIISIYALLKQRKTIRGIESELIKKSGTKLNEKAENLKEINALLLERQHEIEQMAEEMQSQSEAIRKANAELEKLSMVASKTHNIVVIMDANGNFEWVNQGFIDLYGCTMEEFTEKHGENLRENSSNPSISAIINQVYISREPYSYNTRNVDKNGNEVWFQSNITPILDEDGYVDRLVLIDSNITDLKKAESQIKNQKAEIEAHRDELRIINATKDKLFSIIAHDLKNPFNSIIGFSELLQNNYEELDEPSIREYISLIYNSSVTAYQLLQNLLDWSRSQLDRIQLKPEIISVTPLIRMTIELFSSGALSKQIELIDKSDEKAVICADNNMINTVIQNLTNNAIKFTRKGGKVIFETNSGDSFTKIIITDTGIGMPPEKIRSLFDLEEIQSTSGTQGETGTGLGLVVCKEFIEKNNGTISVWSEPGRGTAVTLTLPNSKIENSSGTQ